MSNYCQGEAGGLKETVNIARKYVFFGQLRLKAKMWSEIGVRRFSGRHHNPCGGLHDSAAEA